MAHETLPREIYAGDDLLLAGEAAAGVDGAWETLVTRFAPMVHSLIGRWGFHREADDLSQEIFLLVWKRLATFRGDASLKTWIYQVSLNHLKNHATRRVARRKREISELDLGPEGVSILERAASGDDPAGSLEQKERAALVRKILQQLPVRHREVLVLRDLEDLDYDQIAEVLGVPVGTVKSRISRARSAFAELLERQGGLL